MRDLLVVGGGPAGLAVAIGAARAGFDVAVHERREGVIDKACGEGLMPAAVESLRRLGVEVQGHPIRGIRYLDPTHSVTAGFRSGPGLGVRRTELHRALIQTALDCGVTMVRRTVRSVTQDEDHVEADGTPARYLVAADGLHSAVGASLGLHLPGRGPQRWGQRRHFTVPMTGDLVEVHWAEHGEAYVTPVSDDTIGVAVLSGVRAPFDAQVRGFSELNRRLARAEPASSVRGAGPLRQRTRARSVGRVLLVGDAAGYIDALTGEGIAVALTTAEVVVRCLVDDRPDRYDRGWSRASRRTRTLTAGLLLARRGRWTAGSIVPLAARFPGAFGVAVNQLAGGEGATEDTASGLS